MTDQRPMIAKHHDVTERVIRGFYDVYNERGFAFLEGIYREAIRLALFKLG